MVGVRGFEPPTPASRTQYSTRLSYTPNCGDEFRTTGIRETKTAQGSAVTNADSKRSRYRETGQL